MPFGEKPDVDGTVVDFDVVYEYLIKDVLNRLGLDVIRSDEITRAGWIYGDMFQHILSDEVAIVDITSLNPNVFYELGVRHALRRSVTILIQKKGTRIPFNIRGMRVITYDLDIKSAREAQNEIEKFVRSGLERPGSNDSIVYQVFPDLNVTH